MAGKKHQGIYLRPDREAWFLGRLSWSSTWPAWRYHVPPNLEAQYQRREDGCQGKFCGKAQNVAAQCPKHLDVVVAFQSERGLIVSYFRVLSPCESGSSSRGHKCLRRSDLDGVVHGARYRA